jgi:phage terminase small subunit
MGEGSVAHFQRDRAKTGGRKPGAASAVALPPRQRLFVEQYLLDLNGKKAAIRAGYSPRTAESQASRLLRNVKVTAAVAEGMKRREERTLITQDRVLEELQRLAFSKVTDYVLTDDGQVELAEGAHPDAIAAVSSIKRRVATRGQGEHEVRTVEVELKLWDKPQPLKLAGRHVGLFPNMVQVDAGENTLDGIFARAAARASRRA